MLTMLRNSRLSGRRPLRPATLRLLMALLALGAAALGTASRADAQARRRLARVSRSSLAYVVPRAAAAYIELNLSTDSRKLLDRPNVQELVRLLAGETTGRRLASFDWHGLLTLHLGVAPEKALTEVIGERIAFAAPSWDRMSEAVFVFRLKGPDSLAPALAPGRVARTEKVGNVRVYQTKTGLWIAIAPGVAVLSQSAADGSLFRGVIDLFRGRKKSGKATSLARDPSFAQNVASLRRGHVGYVFFANRENVPIDPQSFLPEFRSGAIGLYSRRNSVDFEIRALSNEDDAALHQTPIDADRMRRLPDSTLLAFADSFDPATALENLFGDQASAQIQRYRQALDNILDLEQAKEDLLPKLGQRIIYVWDRPRQTGSEVLLTVLLESPDPRELTDQIANNFASLAELLSPNDVNDSGDPILQLEEYHGTEILTVRLIDHTPADAVRTPASRLASNIQPSFATLGEWVLLATHPQAIRQIVDAERGWIPQLGEIRALGLSWKKLPETRMSLAVAQPAMASAVVTAWRNTGRASTGEPASQAYGNQKPSVGKVRQPSLGIAVKAADRPGSVLIVRVHADKPADGRLVVGDQIIGVNGQLLDSNDSVGHLRQLIENLKDPLNLSFSVRRNQQLLDVEVSLRPELIETAAEPIEARPLAMLDRLQKLGELMSTGTYTVYKARNNRFHARLMFQLTPNTPATQAP